MNNATDIDTRTPWRLTALGLVFVLTGVPILHAAPSGGPPPIPEGLPGQAVPFEVDSGTIDNPTDALEPAYETVVGTASGPWVRVFFGSGTRLAPGGQIRITSGEDGSVQHHTAETLEQWQNSTAYFNGPEVLVEVLPAPFSTDNRLTVEGLWVGTYPTPTESICGTDDRILSFEPRAGRMQAGGCTAWLINECLLAAGHCMPVNDVVEFNVPLSDSSGGLQHPPASDQYAIDPASVQSLNVGIGDDWSYFGLFPNTETGLTPLQVQGGRYILASNVPEVNGQSIRITGYGTSSTPYEHNQVQQTEAGPYREFVGTVIRYEVDTIGGNSGSPVVDETKGLAIGVHTNAGCDSSPPPYNQGTALNHSGLQTALRNPTGVCAIQAGCDNNGICDPGEDCFSCVADCGHASPNGGCGNDVCEPAGDEDCLSCPADCNGKTGGKPSGLYCCGSDTGCEDERCTAKGNTCSSTSSGIVGYCCGDGTCESVEDAVNCAVDCSTGCTIDADCDDLNECTANVCVANGCQSTPLADDSSCDSGSGICCSGSCMTPVCSVDSDCDDGDVCTEDLCAAAGRCPASCSNEFPSCGPADGCCGPDCGPVDDPDCDCVPTHSKEKGPRCTDGIDNDCDGFIDEADPDC